MAALTKAQLAAEVLKVLGVLGAGQTASAEDSNQAQAAIDGAHDRLRKEGLAVLFTTASVPEWAQDCLRDLAAESLLSMYGVAGERAALIKDDARRGRKDLATQSQAKRHPLPIRANYF